MYLYSARVNNISLRRFAYTYNYYIRLGDTLKQRKQCSKYRHSIIWKSKIN